MGDWLIVPLSGDGGNGESGGHVGGGAADRSKGDGEDVADAVVGAAGHDGGGGGHSAASGDHDGGRGAFAGANASSGATADQGNAGVGGGGETRTSGGDGQGGGGVTLGEEVVGAVAGQGEGDLGDVAGGDVLGEVADLGEAGVDFGVVTGGVGDGSFAIPLKDRARGGLEGGLLEDLVPGVCDVEVHRARDTVALARDEVGLEALLGVVVDDRGGLGGALDAGVVQRQDAGHSSRRGRDGAGAATELDVQLVAEASEKTSRRHSLLA